MNEIRQDNENKTVNSVPQGTASNQYQPLDNNQQQTVPLRHIPNAQSQQNGIENKKEVSPFTERIKKGAWALIGVGIAAMVLYSLLHSSTSVNTTPEAEEALETHMSTTLAAGTKLMSKDESYIGGDLTITHNSNSDETTMYVWDYAAEDGDYVQIIIDGTPMGDPFMIKNKPVSFKVPTVGEIQVVGTRDGGGGITYGVYYELNQTTYFNGMNQGGDNVYTLVRE